jgi:hypothetical protein
VYWAKAVREKRTIPSMAKRNDRFVIVRSFEKKNLKSNKTLLIHQDGEGVNGGRRSDDRGAPGREPS